MMNSGLDDRRPLRVRRRPVEVSVVALAPQGSPRMFRYHSQLHRVAMCTGPERVETGWWRGRQVRRDYFRVITETGEAFWIFRNRDDGRWFMHGVFD